MRIQSVIALTTAALLSACASWDGHVAAADHDPDHKQFMTGSRIAHKGRGGPDAVKTISGHGMREQMRTNMENEPQVRD
jgi:hypothetical protein